MTLPGTARTPRISGAWDERLIRRLRGRDADAIAELYDRYGKLVWSEVVAIVRDTAAAEDLTEETFLRVWNRAHTFDVARGAPGPWLLAIARNRAIEHLRSKSARIERSAADLEIREHPALFTGMDSQVLNASDPDVVRKALGGMNPDWRKAFDLAFYEGLTPTEIAGRLGENPDAVKIWLREAARHLRKALGQAVAA